MQIEPKLTCMTLTHFIVTSDSAVYSWQSVFHPPRTLPFTASHAPLRYRSRSSRLTLVDTQIQMRDVMILS
jgi:hypothetical protein